MQPEVAKTAVPGPDGEHHPAVAKAIASSFRHDPDPQLAQLRDLLRTTRRNMQACSRARDEAEAKYTTLLEQINTRYEHHIHTCLESNEHTLAPDFFWHLFNSHLGAPHSFHLFPPFPETFMTL